MEFSPAPEYTVFPRPGETALAPYQAAVRATDQARSVVRDLQPDVVVADILTVAATLAAELEGVPWATLVPHPLPTREPHWPPFATGARIPRSPVGRLMWRGFDPLVRRGERQGRDELNGARTRVGLPPIDDLHGGISRRLALVATFPQFEYRREQQTGWMEVTGPLLWEPPYEGSEAPPGDDPLVLVAPSTSQDTDHTLLRASLEGLAHEPVRVLATTNRRAPEEPIAVPPNARLVDWFSHSREMPAAAVVVCHGGHGTVARALVSGAPVVACPAAGDMAENAARLAWAGAGVALPRRLVGARGVRLAVRKALGDPGYAARADELSRWTAAYPPGERAAELVERLAAAPAP